MRGRSLKAFSNIQKVLPRVQERRTGWLNLKTQWLINHWLLLWSIKLVLQG